MSSSAAIALSADAQGPRTLTSAVYERLRRDILSAQLLPGQKLHIAHLSKGFGVSLAATREALSRLVADGLVQVADQRGFRVSPVSTADLQDLAGPGSTGRRCATCGGRSSRAGWCRCAGGTGPLRAVVDRFVGEHGAAAQMAGPSLESARRSERLCAFAQALEPISASSQSSSVSMSVSMPRTTMAPKTSVTSWKHREIDSTKA